MRKVNYKVRMADGTIFSTTSYKTARAEGNKILETYLTEEDIRDEKVKEAIKKRMEKVRKILVERRG